MRCPLSALLLACAAGFVAGTNCPLGIQNCLNSVKSPDADLLSNLIANLTTAKIDNGIKSRCYVAMSTSKMSKKAKNVDFLSPS
jgi:hypothetical protein